MKRQLLLTLERSGFDDVELAVGQFETDQLRDGGQHVIVEPNQRVAAQLEFPQLRNGIKGVDRNGGQVVVTQVQFHQIGQSHESGAFHAAYGTALQQDALQVEQSQPPEGLSAQLSQRITTQIQNLHRRFQHMRNVRQSDVVTRDRLLAALPLALALERTNSGRSGRHRRRSIGPMRSTEQQQEQ